MTAARIYVAIALWSSSLLIGRVIPVVLVAEVVLAICLAGLVHALMITFTAWLYRKGDILSILRSLGLRTDRAQFTLLVAAMGAWYLGAAIHDHRTPLNTFVIETAFGIGVWLYVRRAAVGREFARQLRQRLFASRKT